MISGNRLIYPIFLPHAGCPFRCVYCNQQLVTGEKDKFSAADLLDQFEKQIKIHLKRAQTASSVGEIAFYGGTFTALPRDVMGILLTTTAQWVERSVFSGIRFSTRPDCLSAEVVDLLSGYPIRTVELGVQSLVDDVLDRSRRGYNAATVEEAARRVRERGWRLGIQLMPALPGDSEENFRKSIERTVEIGPEFVRLYPTIVLEKTELASRYRQGRYQPLTLEEAVSWCANALETLAEAEIRVIRMGLHADRALLEPGRIIAGPYHPAFGYLVKSARWKNRVDRRMEMEKAGCNGRELVLEVPAHLRSEVIGHRCSNLEHWRRKWGIRDVKVVNVPGDSGFEFSLYWK